MEVSKRSKINRPWRCYFSDLIFRLGLIGGALFLGLITGIILSSHVYSIHKEYGYIITFSVSSFIHFLTLTYTYFFVPETVERNEESDGITGIFKSELLKEMFTCFLKKRENNGRAVLILATFSLASCVVTLEGEKDIKYLFTRSYFKWNLAKFQSFMAVHTATVIIGKKNDSTKDIENNNKNSMNFRSSHRSRSTTEVFQSQWISFRNRCFFYEDCWKFILFCNTT